MIKLFEEYNNDVDDKCQYIYDYLSIADYDTCPELYKILEKIYSGAMIYLEDIPKLTKDEINYVYNYLKDKFGKLELEDIKDYFLACFDFVGSDNFIIEINDYGYFVIIDPQKDKIDDMLYIIKEIKQVEKRCPNNIFTISIDDGLHSGFCIRIKIE